MEPVLQLLLAACTIAIAALVWVTVRPPARSSAALRRRMDELSEVVDEDHVQLKRLVKRYRALEGHVYGSMSQDDDDDEEQLELAGDRTAAPAGQNPSPTEGAGTLSLLPDPDFPEEEFQRQLALRRHTRA